MSLRSGLVWSESTARCVSPLSMLRSVIELKCRRSALRPVSPLKPLRSEIELSQALRAVRWVSSLSAREVGDRVGADPEDRQPCEILDPRQTRDPGVLGRQGRHRLQQAAGDLPFRTEPERIPDLRFQVGILEHHDGRGGAGCCRTDQSWGW